MRSMQQNVSADLSELLNNIQQLHSEKKWHQLTEALLQFVKNDHFTNNKDLIDFYNNFISDFEKKLNPLSLVEMICPYVIRQFRDAKKALEFLEILKEKVKESNEAQVLCLSAMGNIKLMQHEHVETKEIVEKCEELLQEMPGMTPVHGKYYEMCSNYHQVMSDHNKYYRDALRYLGCIDIDEMSNKEQMERAFNLGLAGLLGDKVYNFGELLQHKVLNALKNSSRQWLVDLLYAFNSGNIQKLNELKKYWGKQPDLNSSELKLRQKCMLLSLMEMTFKRPSNKRQLTFKEISKETTVAPEEVEILAMKAMSLGLVRGSIDQMEQKVIMNWVQPRVLDPNQVENMMKRVEMWRNDVTHMEKIMVGGAQSIMT